MTAAESNFSFLMLISIHTMHFHSNHFETMVW